VGARGFLDEQATPRLHSNLHQSDRTRITRNGEFVVAALRTALIALTHGWFSRLDVATDRVEAIHVPRCDVRERNFVVLDALESAAARKTGRRGEVERRCKRGGHAPSRVRWQRRLGRDICVELDRRG
jgi:hypothetical protein